MSETEFVSCQSIAPLLMELFDGEADEISAKRARAHLLACEHCAQAWLEWNQTQSILRTHPVPAPPPTLMWRIVLAARFANFKRQNRFAFFSRKKAPTLGALYGAFEPHEAPASMKAQILAATSRQKSAQPVSSAASYSTKKKSAWPAFSMMAAPALAAFLLVASRGSLDNLQSTPVASETQPSLEEAPAVRQVAKQRVAVSAVAPKKAVVVAAAPRTVKPDLKVESNQPEVAEPRVQPVNERDVEAKISALSHRPAVREVSLPHVEAQPRPESRPFAHPDVAEVNEAPPARLVILPILKPRPVRNVTIVVQPKTLAIKAAFSNDVDRPRTQVAPLKVAKLQPIRLLANDVTPLPTRVTKPVVSAPKITLAATYDDSDSDQHIDELQSVVADFRSALSNDGTDDAYASDES